MGCVKIDGKVRTDHNYPAGFMDVVELDKSGDKFRLLYDVKGRFVLHRIDSEEASFKLCRIQKTHITAGKVPVVVTHDGRTIRYPDPLIKVNDTVKVDIATGKITSFSKFELGTTVMIIRGRNAGRVGTLTHVKGMMDRFLLLLLRILVVLLLLHVCRMLLLLVLPIKPIWLRCLRERVLRRLFLRNVLMLKNVVNFNILPL